MNLLSHLRVPRCRATARTIAAATVALWSVGIVAAQASHPAEPQVGVEPMVGFAAGHAAWVHAELTALLEETKDLAKAIERLRARPDAANLAAAREAWCVARRRYGKLEVTRFQDGPIEPLEPGLNAWPVDEAHIDLVQGGAATGIIPNRTDYPGISAAVLRLANERGGEANVSLGWHAIEFLLWGQDMDPAGPGARSARDFDAQQDPLAVRRGEYLAVATGVLLADLQTLRAAWAPARQNHRREFEANPRNALRAALAGCTVLTAFELGGERLTVPFETRDQEQEHSCFSDTTLADLEANQAGIRAVCLGVAGTTNRGVVGLLRPAHAELADLLTERLTATSAAIAAIPAPFDQAMLGDDEAPGRRAIAAAIRAMEEQTEALLLVGAHFGFDLPLKPGS